MPNWPELMDLETASSYLSLSPSSFKVVSGRADVRPVDLGLRLLRYRKLDLDRMVHSLAGRGASRLDEDEEAGSNELVARALARVEQRSRRHH